MQVTPSSLLRVSMHRSPPLSPKPPPPLASSEAVQDALPPLRRPAPSPERSPREAGATTPRTSVAPEGPSFSGMAVESPTVDMTPMRPNFVRCVQERLGQGLEDSPAPAALVPRLRRPDYYVSPSIEAMAAMSEASLSRLDNLEIGRYGYGSVKWPGLTDVRRINFDEVVFIDRGGLTVYPDREKPKDRARSSTRRP
ncbi:unnamed protein product [Prorocentrum cordatum]|uniref:Peptidase S59 domain-containing protein n=1 Tax=Prorocentrum cordatum TaxID=2364126 RepID=A0ABN9TM40_9DINO|nr:unnamed protein product [Polarella glacialis]